MPEQKNINSLNKLLDYFIEIEEICNGLADDIRKLRFNIRTRRVDYDYIAKKLEEIEGVLSVRD